VLAVVVLAKAFDNFHISAEEALERSKKGLANLKESASEAKEEVEEIKSSFDQYQSVLDTLNNCTKGTEEWNNALNDVKNSVNDILEKYPEYMRLQEAIKWDAATGTYLINEDTMGQFIQDKEN
jgi:archaellum component FlaC